MLKADSHWSSRFSWMAVSSPRAFAWRYQKYASMNTASAYASSHAHDENRIGEIFPNRLFTSSEPGARAILQLILSNGVRVTRVAPDDVVSGTASMS